jgi:uncharacterized membrane protein YfcA
VLVLIGLAAGFFSALFGVGGGILIVPLLVLAARFAERTAMATSLAAIGVTALAGTVVYAYFGRVEPAPGALVVSGLLGVGGGLLFVPTLLALGLGQREAAATSLLAILPTVAAGTWRQRRYGNIRWRPALVVGFSSIAGAAGGVFAAEALPELVLRRLFAALLVAVAAQLAWRVLRTRE